MTVRHPGITARIIGADSNAGTLMGITVEALRRGLRAADVPATEIATEINAFRTEALSGDYDHLIQTITRWVEVE